MRRALQILLIAAVTLGCLAYAIAGMEWSEVRASFARANYWSLPPMMLMLTAFYCLKAWRWSLLLRPVKELSPVAVTPAMMIGFMANNLLPAHLGEFVRVFVLGRQFGLKKTPVLSTIVLERVFDVLAILLLLGFSLPFVQGMPPDLKRFSQVFAGLSLMGVLVLLSYMVFTRQFVRLAEAVLNRVPLLPARVKTGVLDMLVAGAVGLASVRNPRLLAGIAISSLAQWILNAGMIFASMWAFGVEGSYFDAIMVMGVIVFAILLPSPPGYFGVIQACFVAVLGTRFAQSDVFGCSVYYHMCQYVPVTLTGLFFVNRIGLTLASLQSQATAAELTEPTESPESSAEKSTR